MVIIKGFRNDHKRCLSVGLEGISIIFENIYIEYLEGIMKAT